MLNSLSYNVGPLSVNTFGPMATDSINIMIILSEQAIWMTSDCMKAKRSFGAQKIGSH
jgi:hypothetical protein